MEKILKILNQLTSQSYFSQIHLSINHMSIREPSQRKIKDSQLTIFQVVRKNKSTSPYHLERKEHQVSGDRIAEKVRFIVYCYLFLTQSFTISYKDGPLEEDQTRDAKHIFHPFFG